MPNYHIVIQDHPSLAGNPVSTPGPSAKQLKKAGKLINAGALVDKQRNLSDPVILLKVGSLEETKQLLESDIYHIQGIWDLANATIQKNNESFLASSL